jgi:hemerythrin-like metal-binding protein
MGEQHKQMLELLARLYDLVSTEFDPEDAGKVLREILGATQIHFHAEEDLMRRHQYPGARAHQQHHREIVRRLQEKYPIPIARDTLEITPHAVRSVANSFVAHVSQEDKKYGAYIGARQSAGAR